MTAGIQSARMGAATLIVEETEWLGGMLTLSLIHIFLEGIRMGPGGNPVFI